MKKEEFIFDERYMGSLVFDHVSKVYGENNENVASHKLLEKLGFECYFSTIKYNRCYAEPTHLTHMYLTREMFENRNSQK